MIEVADTTIGEGSLNAYRNDKFRIKLAKHIILLDE
jgi:hypothetical protein